MEDTRMKLLDKHQKKIDKEIDELELIIDATKFGAMNSGEDLGVCTQLVKARDHLRQASYCMLLAIASAEGQEITGQMMADLESMRKASEE